VYVESEKEEYDGKDDRREVRATAFVGEGRQNIGGDLVTTAITSDSCHLVY
jgi:hypothetical protein